MLRVPRNANYPLLGGAKDFPHLLAIFQQHVFAGNVLLAPHLLPVSLECD